MSTTEHEPSATGTMGTVVSGRTTTSSPSTADELQVPRTRTSSAWVAAAVGAVLVLLMLVFILQNSSKVQMDFLWMEFSLPLGVAMLLAAVLGALIVVSLGIGRMLQLRLAAHRHRKADRRAASRH